MNRRRVGVLVLLVAVLAATRTPAGSAAVGRLRSFLEFYSGVFALLAMTATTVAGVVAAQQAVPARFRILVQAAHRATALMTVGFLVAHVLLKVMEAHATVLDVAVPFLGSFYVGVGTVASDLLIVVMATGLLRRRFAGRPRPWLWRTVHVLAYATWPLSIVHGLLAGRTPKSWVTLSYVVCVALVVAASLARLPQLLRDRSRRVPAAAPSSAPSASSMSSAPIAGPPDEEFWRLLRAEARQWMGDRR